MWWIHNCCFSSTGKFFHVFCCCHYFQRALTAALLMWEMPLGLANEPNPQRLDICCHIFNVPPALSNSVGIPFPIWAALLGEFSLKMNCMPFIPFMALLQAPGILALQLRDVPFAPRTAPPPSWHQISSSSTNFHQDISPSGI